MIYFQSPFFFRNLVYLFVHKDVGIGFRNSREIAVQKDASLSVQNYHPCMGHVSSIPLNTAGTQTWMIWNRKTHLLRMPGVSTVGRFVNSATRQLN